MKMLRVKFGRLELLSLAFFGWKILTCCLRSQQLEGATTRGSQSQAHHDRGVTLPGALLPVGCQDMVPQLGFGWMILTYCHGAPQLEGATTRGSQSQVHHEQGVLLLGAPLPVGTTARIW
jgi:hypothetical protein